MHEMRELDGAIGHYLSMAYNDYRCTNDGIGTIWFANRDTGKSVGHISWNRDGSHTVCVRVNGCESYDIDVDKLIDRVRTLAAEYCRKNLYRF